MRYFKIPIVVDAWPAQIIIDNHVAGAPQPAAIQAAIARGGWIFGQGSIFFPSWHGTQCAKPTDMILAAGDGDVYVVTGHTFGLYYETEEQAAARVEALVAARVELALRQKDEADMAARKDAAS